MHFLCVAQTYWDSKSLGCVLLRRGSTPCWLTGKHPMVKTEATCTGQRWRTVGKEAYVDVVDPLSCFVWRHTLQPAGDAAWHRGGHTIQASATNDHPGNRVAQSKIAGSGISSLGQYKTRSLSSASAPCITRASSFLNRNIFRMAPSSFISQHI